MKFRPVILEFTLLKRAIFAAIRPQFDDVLHSSRRRFQTESASKIFWGDFMYVQYGAGMLGKAAISKQVCVISIR